MDAIATGVVGSSTLAQSPELWARELLASADGLVGYGLVFVLAAIPLVEILVVIPLGIGLGFQPVGVAVAAFLGNVLPIYGIIVAHERIEEYLQQRRASEPSSRRQRAKRLWDKYGLPGLAIASPVSTGVHLAAIFALGVGSPRRSTAVWMTASIAVWTVALTSGSILALETVQSLL